MILEYTLIERNGKKPQKPFFATGGSAGLDLSVSGDDITVKPGCHTLVQTGIKTAIPEGYAGLVFVRSSLGIKRGLMLSNSVGVIDSDYRGEILVSLYNTSSCEQLLKSGERIAQLVIVPYICPELVERDELDETVRGGGGFVSTGK